MQNKMTTRKVKIGKKEAQELLENNTDNRTLRVGYVSQLAKAMQNGDFVDEFASLIIVDIDGVLRNGQHTLSAIVKSDTVHWLNLVENAPADSYKFIDQNLARAFSDGAGLYTPNATYQASVARMLMREEQGSAHPNTMGEHYARFSQAEILDYIENNPEINITYQRARRIGRQLGVSPSTVGFCEVMFWRYDEDKAEAFMDALDTGANLKQGDAVLALRQRLLSSKDDKNKATRNKTKLAYIIKAFNYFVAGRELRCLKWNEKSEGMPKVGAIVR